MDEFQKPGAKRKEPDTKDDKRMTLFTRHCGERGSVGTEIRSVAARRGNDIDHRMVTFYIIEISHVLTVLVVIGLYMVVIVYEFQLNKPDLK